jgi:hypothetical protein
MVAVAASGVILAGAVELTGVSGRRSEYLSRARYYRWRESFLRQSAARLLSCPSGHAPLDRGATRCRSCSGNWASSGLKAEIVALADAVRSLHHAADVFEAWALRYERAARRPWRPPPPATPTMMRDMRTLVNGDGPIVRKYFDVL